jgi:uncharacterized protein
MKREELMRLLQDVGLSRDKIYHCDLVADIALAIGERVRRAGHSINLETVEQGAMLHDIGICATWDDASPIHATVGADMVRKLGFSEEVARCIESHELLGLPKDEAQALGMPIYRDTFVPQNWEEKVVMFADHVALAWGECERDLWADPLCIAKANYPYLQVVFARWAKITITPEHPCNQRGVEVYKEMMPFLEKKDLERLEEKAVLMRHAQTEAGIKLPFAYAENLVL